MQNIENDSERIIKEIRKFFLSDSLKNFKTKLDYYEIEKLLGQGTYGKVYAAKHKLVDKKVALKCIEKTHIKSFATMNKIFNEVEILNNLNHDNIIKLYEIFENPKFYFFVTEYVENGDLF